MKDVPPQFEKYRAEHSRLRDPELVRSSVELIPVAMEPFAKPAPPVPSGNKRLAKGQRRRERSKRLPQLPPDLIAPPEPDIAVGSAPGDQPGHERFTEYLWQKTSAAGAAPPQLPGPASANLPDLPKKAKITISPPALSRRISLFQDQQFEFSAPGGQQVEMAWLTAGGGEVHRAQMDRASPDIFRATVSLADGEYLLGYLVDGVMQTDGRSARRVLLRGDGLFAPFELKRYWQPITLHNRGRTDEIVRLETDAKWLAAEPLLTLPANNRIQTLIRLAPQAMSQGLNRAKVRALTQGNGADPVAEVEVAIEAETNGMIAEMKCHHRRFDSILQGVDSLEVSVEVAARGSGALNGMILLRHTEEIANFRIEASSESARHSHTFTIDSGRLPYREQGSLKLTLITDSYLANYRLLQTEVPYRLIYLKKSLPALAFGRMAHGTTRTLRLEIERSDGQKIEIDVAPPEEIKHCLEFYPLSDSAFSFRLDTRVLAPGDKISQEIMLTDRVSGLRDRMKVLAEVSPN